MPFLVVLPRAQVRILNYYVSLFVDDAWVITNNVSAGTAPWQSSGSYAFDVPVPSAGQGFRDAGGRFWLYGALYLSGDAWAATYDFGTQRAVARWQLSGTTQGGVYSAVDDGSGGIYAVAPIGPFANWVVHYAGTGSSATATTTSDTTWLHAFTVGTPPTVPHYALGLLWAIWTQGGSIYGLVMGEYNPTWSGGHVFVASLWTCGTSDPTNAANWSFMQYLAHYDLSTGSGYWGNWEEERLAWRMPVRVGTDVYFPTGMNIVGSSPFTPYDHTVVWRQDAAGAVTADLAIPQPGGTDETWGGPLAVYADPVYGAEVYWAQFTFPAAWTWATDTGTITLWRRRAGVWAAISSTTIPLTTVYHPMLSTMIGTATGLWLLFDAGDHWFTIGRDPAPTIHTWDAATDTWGTGATIAAFGEFASPRIWQG